jgi:hypothetical protein
MCFLTLAIPVDAFIAHINFIYLSILSNRIPIISHLTPTYGDKCAVFRFSELFHLLSSEKSLGTRILEGHQIKEFRLGTNLLPQETDRLHLCSAVMPVGNGPLGAGCKSQTDPGLSACNFILHAVGAV